ncbi:MAG: restriction endonuclease subunit S [Pseudomonadota bacterium]|nr:restriction endonuclease subunit S [Pseudomonadota bacterium]
MGGEWQERSLGELTENFDSVRIPVKRADRRAGPYPYYGASGIVDFVDKFLFDGQYLLIAEDGENLRTRNTPVAFLAHGKFWVNNHAHIVRGNSDADTRFLMYALSQQDISGYLTGSTMPKLTQGNLDRILILAPPLPEQRAIAHILGTLDDKIELNRRMGETLKAMARAFFKSWFVDFDPVRAKAEGRNPGLPKPLADLFPDRLVESELGEIPEGWEVKPLDSIAGFQNGLALKKYRPTETGGRLPVVKIASFVAARAVCAMLNHRGGRVLFGVAPDGRVVGQEVGDRTIEEVAQELREIDPPAFPDIDRVELGGGREVLVITVPIGRNRPYSVRGQAYRRVGNTNQPLSREEYNRMLLERVHAEMRWENEPAAGWSVADLDQGEVLRTLEEGIRVGRVEDPGTREPGTILRGLGLLKDGALLRAAVVLFGRGDRILPDFTQCLLRVARFKGTEKGEFLDNRQFRGHAFELFQQAQRFILDHMPIAGRFEAGRMERIDEPLYPPLALREAIANAICHRDYASGGSSIGVAMYDDRLEISSSGTLHFGLTPQALFEPHESRPWNPLIASVFYRRGIIETWGQGTLKMAAWAEEAGLPRPEIEEIPGAVVVRFRPSRYVPPLRVGHDLTERQQAVLGMVAARPEGLPLREISAALQDPPAEWELKNDLALLKKLGLVEPRGHGRGAVWVLVNKGSGGSNP